MVSLLSIPPKAESTCDLMLFITISFSCALIAQISCVVFARVFVLFSTLVTYSFSAK